MPRLDCPSVSAETLTRPPKKDPKPPSTQLQEITLTPPPKKKKEKHPALQEITGTIDDFREKGAWGALKDATLDAVDLVQDAGDRRALAILLWGAPYDTILGASL